MSSVRWNFCFGRQIFSAPFSLSFPAHTLYQYPFHWSIHDRFFQKTHASPAPSFSLPPALPPGCRGIFYRIFLSRTIGAEDLGIFNMVHPVYGICFALRAGSIQTAISRIVAADVQKGKQIFRTGLVISLTLSIALAAFVRQQVSFLLILSYISLS